MAHIDCHLVVQDQDWPRDQSGCLVHSRHVSTRVSLELIDLALGLRGGKLLARFLGHLIRQTAWVLRLLE
jgi:hypothetical protein